jgi:hypothetical protein
MKAMTNEQIATIFQYLDDQGAAELFNGRQMNNLRSAVERHTAGTEIFSFEQGEATIKMIEDAISNNIALQKEKAKKAKAAEKTTNKSIKEDNVKAIQPKEEVIVIIEDGFDTPINNNKKEATTMAPNTCQKCSGTGLYNVPLKDGSIGKCFTCKGTGTKQSSTRSMSEPQIKFIRDLFKQVKEHMTEDEINNLVKAMRGHIDGTEIKSITWASAAIDKLKLIKAKNAC